MSARGGLALSLSVLLGAGLARLAPSGQDPTPAQPGSDARDPEEVERGRHLVHEVAQCIQCHSPRDLTGKIVEERLLTGAPIPIEPPVWAGDERGWAFRAPHIAGLPGYRPEEAVRLLVEGLDPSGEPPRAPMPPFRMTEEEARAVVAYLLTLD